MILNDKVNFKGVFSIKEFHSDGTETELTENNLIVNTARTNMAKIIGGNSNGGPIDKIVLGTQGYNDTILDYKLAGSDGFDTTRTELFSEDTTDDDYNYYSISFDASSSDDETTVDGTGTLYLGDTAVYTDSTMNTITRTISDRTVTYEITIPADCANPNSSADTAIPYTEAALYAGDDMFSMKCYSARVKEDSVKLVITWSIIF